MVITSVSVTVQRPVGDVRTAVSRVGAVARVVLPVAAVRVAVVWVGAVIRVMAVVWVVAVVRVVGVIRVVTVVRGLLRVDVVWVAGLVCMTLVLLRHVTFVLSAVCRPCHREMTR